MQATQYDAIVVGSGISGGWAAKELTEKVLKTLVLERGRLVASGPAFLMEAGKRLGFDPAIASSPFVASLVDVTGLVVYFNIARQLLHLR